MILSLNNIRKSYTKGPGIYREIIKGIDLEVNNGDTIAITGPSGTGKTTLLNIIGKMDEPDSGEIKFNGTDLSNMSNSEILNFRNQDIGFVFQLHHLLPQCNLLENVLIPTIPTHVNHKTSVAKAEEILNNLDIWHLRNQKPSEMSVGECQRAAVARAIINDPTLLLADEPTGALDSENTRRLAELFVKLNETLNLTIIVVTHSEELAGFMNKRYNLQNGILTQIQ